MAPGGEMFRYSQHFGENVLPRGSLEWLPYSVNEVRLKSPNTNLPVCLRKPIYIKIHGDDYRAKNRQRNKRPF